MQTMNSTIKVDASMWIQPAGPRSKYSHLMGSLFGISWPKDGPACGQSIPGWNYPYTKPRDLPPCPRCIKAVTNQLTWMTAMLESYKRGEPVFEEIE